MAGEHALFSASGAARWAHCLGSLAMCQGLPEGPSSVHAAEGTLYHEIAADMLKWGKDDYFEYVGTEMEADGFKFTVTRENLDHMMKYVNAIRARPGAKLYEVKLDTSGVMGIPGQFATGDCVIIDGDTIEVHDLKFGAGERVDAFIPPPDGEPMWKGLNDQLTIYGAAAFLSEEFFRDIKRIRVAIHQPRYGNGHYDDAGMSPDELRAFITWLTERAQKAKALLTAPREEVLKNLTPSDKACRWCPLKLDCPGRNKALADEFDDLSAKPAQNLSDEDIAAARTKVDEIERWCKDIKAEAQRRAENGRVIKGWRLSEPRPGNRAWADPAKVEQLINGNVGDSDLAYEKALIGPAEAERRFKSDMPKLWAELNGNPDKKTKKPTTETFIVRPQGQRTLVRDFGKGPAPASTDSEFDVVSPISEFM